MLIDRHAQAFNCSGQASDELGGVQRHAVRDEHAAQEVGAVDARLGLFSAEPLGIVLGAIPTARVVQLCAEFGQLGLVGGDSQVAVGGEVGIDALLAEYLPDHREVIVGCLLVGQGCVAAVALLDRLPGDRQQG